MSGGVRYTRDRATLIRSKVRPAAGELRAAVAESASIAGTLRRLQRPVTGTQRALLRKWIAEAGISTAHFLGQAHGRGKTGTVSAKRPEDILVKHDGRCRTRTRLLRRALREVGVTERCAECGVMTIDGIICGCCAPTAMRPRAPGVEVVGEGILTPGKVRLRLAPVLQLVERQVLGTWCCRFESDRAHRQNRPRTFVSKVRGRSVNSAEQLP